MSPEYIQNISQDVIDLYIQTETQLLLNISEKLKLNKITLDNASDWQIDRLKELNGLTEANIKTLAKQSGETIEEVGKVFQNATDMGASIDTATIDKGIEAGVLNPILNEKQIIMNALQLATKETLTTFNQVNKSMLASANREYTKIVNKIATNVLAGTQDINSAIKQSIGQLADNGVVGFTAKNGAQWSTEAYTSMVMKSNVVNTIQKVQDDRIKASGGSYIEINSYVGARPLCSQDQGQIFSLNDDTTPITDINGKTIRPRRWSDSTHGRPAGIFGINCGHSKFMFVPEISSYNRETIDKKENDKQYETNQQQRLLERRIRSAKTEKVMLERAKADEGLIKDAGKKIGERQKDMRTFIKQNDLTRRPAREYVEGYTGPTKKAVTIAPKPIIPKAPKVRPLTNEDKGQIRIYTTINYKEMNMILNKKDESLTPNLRDYFKKEIPRLSKALNKLPNFEGDVYRIVSIPDNELDKYIKQFVPNASYKAPSFLSTSQNFNSTFGAKNINVMMKIRSKTGKDIKEYSNYYNEKEILFDKGGKFNVKSVKKNNSNIFEIEMEEI